MKVHFQLGRSKIGWTMAFGLAVAVAAVISLGVVKPNVAQSCDVPAQCNADGMIVGQVTNIPGPYPRMFDVFVTDHKPGEGFWVEIPGSRQTVTAHSSTVAFGPLDISQVRAGVNSIRVEQTASTAKSDSFSPCPHKTSTPTATATNTPVPPTATATNTPVPLTATATNTPVPLTATATNTPVPPTATATNTPVPLTATATNTPNTAATPTDTPSHHERHHTATPVSAVVPAATSAPVSQVKPVGVTPPVVVAPSSTPSNEVQTLPSSGGGSGGSGSTATIAGAVVLLLAGGALLSRRRLLRAQR